MQTGPYRSALNSVRAGAVMFELSGDGSGAIKSYSMVMFFPGLRPTGPRAPTVMVNVCPSPSGDRLVFSSVIPLLTSVLIWSASISLPLILMVMAEISGASNNPGISSVILIKLIFAEPLFVKVKVAFTFCER